MGNHDFSDLGGSLGVGRHARLQLPPQPWVHGDIRVDAAVLDVQAKHLPVIPQIDEHVVYKRCEGTQHEAQPMLAQCEQHLHVAPVEIRQGIDQFLRQGIVGVGFIPKVPRFRDSAVSHPVGRVADARFHQRDPLAIRHTRASALATA